MSDLVARYGTRTRRRWLLPAIVVVGISLGIGWALWVSTTDKPFSARLYGYEVTGEHQTIVKLDIHRPKPAALECTVNAQAEDHSIVGERTITIASSDQQTIRTETSIVTERRAVTGILKGCRVVP